METIKFEPLATTKKEKLGNDLCIMVEFLKGPHTYINEELIYKLREEFKRLYEIYKEEEK